MSSLPTNLKAGKQVRLSDKKLAMRLIANSFSRELSLHNELAKRVIWNFRNFMDTLTKCEELISHEYTSFLKIY